MTKPTISVVKELEEAFNSGIKAAQERIWAKGLPIVYVEDGEIVWKYKSTA